MEENEGKNLAAEKKIQKFEKELKELISEINEEKSRIVCGNVAMNVEKRDDKFECFIGGHKIITCKDGEVSYNVQELQQLYKEIEKMNNEDRPIPDLLESMGLPKLDDLKDYEEKRKNEEQRNGANQAKKEEPEKAEEKEEPEKGDDIDGEEKEPENKTRGLLELNLGVLVLINPALRGVSKAYLDPNTNSLVFKDRFGKEHGPEEYGFHELKAEDTNFELTKMDANGEITYHENPTRLYSVEGQRQGFGIAIDFATHHREVNLVVKDNYEGHEDSYAIINGNLAKFDSGDIPTTKTSYDIGIREGILKSGDRNETNEKAKEILDNESNETRQNLQKGFAEQGNTINDNNDLKKAIADVLEEEYNEEPEEAMEIATEIVDEGKMYEEIKAEREEQDKNSKKTGTNDDNDEYDPRDPRAGDPRWQ